MKELQFIRAGRLEWREKEPPTLQHPQDAIVRPFVAGRCDGDTLPIHRPVTRAMQIGMHLGLIDPVVRSICGPAPFKGPFGIGHECVAEVISVGEEVRSRRVGEVVVVPWAVSCGGCPECLRGLTAKCSTTRSEVLAAYGFGAKCGCWGGMVVDELRVPYADHMLAPVPAGVDPLRVAAASDNLADAWRCIVPPLRERPGGSVVVLGGGALSIGLYAAGLAVAHGAAKVDYIDHDAARLEIASSFGADVIPLKSASRKSLADRLPGRYDIAVEASSRADGVRSALRLLRPGGVCTPVGYYLSPGTRLPLMHMYANDATLKIGVSHVRPALPELLQFVADNDFPAERVTTLTADWNNAPTAYAARTTKLVIHRAPRLQGDAAG
ncbi:NADP-dependent isopropanol dehydrogenase [Posidoniimonas corsicana]|uniref:NADP-dependent isopropanol dehydrogenase n=1 Tax=Posidoniimonas corsicana TaxID=1938618 RepID=A0A5C5UVD6_9BACT|nr:zinc-binding dehydrogenase [Posidoniimonas corsicana]TWT30351.1 NADP-dependent isopropanol dehydrogenase [Posidoniimonas corsicana]